MLIGEESCVLLLLPLFSELFTKTMERNAKPVKSAITSPSELVRILPKSPLRVVTSPNTLSFILFRSSSI